MSVEIKLIHADVEKALAGLKASIQTLETSFSKSMQGENRLDTVTKLNEINQSFERVLNSYQTLLVNNQEATSNAAESFKQTEEKVASRINF
ncbi:YwqI/YxiC family protein [Virgibacillus necropolis]|uniref:YwqI/YxiC family protein n=1 Tax=Virgibacillus necropolis TaxID=163877 RepID=UPI00126A2DD9|nr:YwqI/YxiC family protein [Virgibacillus necropolis]